MTGWLPAVLAALLACAGPAARAPSAGPAPAREEPQRPATIPEVPDPPPATIPEVPDPPPATIPEVPDPPPATVPARPSRTTPPEVPDPPSPPRTAPPRTEPDRHACAAPADCTLLCDAGLSCCGHPCGCRNAVSVAWATWARALPPPDCRDVPCPPVGCAYEPAFGATCRDHRCVPLSGLGF